MQYSISETDAERTGTITISYTNAADISVTVQQAAPTCIILPETEDVVSYESGEYSFDYSIQSPAVGASLYVSCRVDWVSEISVQMDKITFNLAENASVSPRSCQFFLSYGSYHSTEFTLTQEAMPVQSITLDRTSLDMIAGQQETLTVTIVPEDAEYVWKSSNENVATVRDGQVSAVGGGTATITATSGDKSATCEVMVAQTVDLSSSATANCYIVNKPGIYKFKPVKGNTDTSVGTVASAEVLWESYGTEASPSVGSIVKSASYEDGYIYFATPSELKNGNAVIAVKNSDGEIIWSWHIWVCEGWDPTETEQVYYNNAGTMMDRNLGATSATPGDVHALGLLYQWGRKDPFLGGKDISSNTTAASTHSWPSVVKSDASTGTIAYAVAHPMTFISENYNNYDWYYSTNESTDNTRWNSSKGIYDPCPAGWRVPDGGDNGFWIKAFGTQDYIQDDNNWDSTNMGMDFGSTSPKIGSGTIWYPAAGQLLQERNNPVNRYVGKYGYYWTCFIEGHSAYFFNFMYFNNKKNAIYPYQHNTTVIGFSVRCQKQE